MCPSPPPTESLWLPLTSGKAEDSSLLWLSPDPGRTHGSWQTLSSTVVAAGEILKLCFPHREWDGISFAKFPSALPTKSHTDCSRAACQLPGGCRGVWLWPPRASLPLSLSSACSWISPQAAQPFEVVWDPSPLGPETLHPSEPQWCLNREILEKAWTLVSSRTGRAFWLYLYYFKQGVSKK